MDSNETFPNRSRNSRAANISPSRPPRLLNRDLIQISNDLPNHYVLSFSPQSPDPGFHVLELKLKDRPDLEVRARNAYWIDADTTRR